MELNEKCINLHIDRPHGTKFKFDLVGRLHATEKNLQSGLLVVYKRDVILQVAANK